MSEPVELSENVLHVENKTRNWNVVRVDLTEFTCAGRVLSLIGPKPEARFYVILEEVGRGRWEPRLAADMPCNIEYKPRQMHFVPAGFQFWGFTEDSRMIKEITLSFEVEALRERLGVGRQPHALEEPRFRFTNERIWTLAGLLSDVVEDKDPSSQLYGDSLIAAIGARLFEAPPVEAKAVPKLSPLQLKDAIGYLESQLPHRVELATLAALAGLSQSHYSRAFKASTGLAPYQWQLQARIDLAKNLLLHTRKSLEDVAQATGFADAVHFGRTFRKLTGNTPIAWRTQQLG